MHHCIDVWNICSTMHSQIAGSGDRLNKITTLVQNLAKNSFFGNKSVIAQLMLIESNSASWHIWLIH